MGTLFRFLSIVAAAELFLSCSIKSDRSDCPCHLSIVLDSPRDSMEFVMSRNGQAHLDTVLLASDFREGVCELEIVRGSYVFSLHDGSAVIETGCQSDSLFAWSSIEELDAECDEMSIYPEFGKQFSTLFLEVLTEDSEICEVDVVFDGSVGGLDLFSLIPLSGNFHYSLSSEPSGEYSVRIPRQVQGRDDLVLELRDSKGREARLPVSDYISSTGYDWTETSLKDLYINVNCSFSCVDLLIEDWNEGFSTPFEL